MIKELMNNDSVFIGIIIVVVVVGGFGFGALLRSQSPNRLKSSGGTPYRVDCFEGYKFINASGKLAGPIGECNESD